MTGITRLTGLVTTIMVVAGVALGSIGHGPAAGPVVATTTTGGIAHG